MLEKSRVVEIRKGGGIYYTEWEDGKYVEREVSETINNHLFDPCYFEDGTQLKDIFDVVEPNIDLFDILMPHEHISEFVAESKMACTKENDESKDMSLLLSWCVEHEKSEKELSSYITFDGVSHEDEDVEYGRMSVSFIPINHLISCEVKQNQNFNVWGGLGYAVKVPSEPIIKLDCKSFHYWKSLMPYSMNYPFTVLQRKETNTEKS